VSLATARLAAESGRLASLAASKPCDLVRIGPRRRPAGDVMAPINVSRRGRLLRGLAADGFGYRFLIPAFGVVGGVDSGNSPGGGFRPAEVGGVT
jgi:hypothetical protein